jgi:BioD-like phosphotransacetylase family protein
MPTLLVVSPQAFAGKTTVAAGLVQKAQQAGKSFSLKRLDGGDHAAADAEFFAGLRGVAEGAQVALIEAPGSDSAGALSQAPDARALVIVNASEEPAEVATHCAALGSRLASVIVNRVATRRLEALRKAYGAAGVTPLAFLPEDRVLAAPVLGQVASALQAESRFLEGNRLRPLDRPLIASISADPGQGYFSQYGATAVIVRSDKPDLQLAALNAGANCLIVTGGLPILSYVLERAEEDEIPLLRTNLDTVSTMGSIEALYASMPFSGGDVKMRRVKDLLADVDVSALFG